MSDEEKIETCFLCGKKFDMNNKYPICDYCAEFYSFYKEDL